MTPPPGIDGRPLADLEVGPGSGTGQPSPVQAMPFALSGWRPRMVMVVVAALVGSLLVTAVPAAPVAGQSPAPKETSPQTQRLPLADLPGDPEVTGHPVSMAGDGSSVAWTQYGSEYGSVGRYWVLDEDSDESGSPLLQELEAPGVPTQIDGVSQISGSGMSFVAEYSTESNVGACTSGSGPGPGVGGFYNQQQIIKWDRSTPNGEFDDPVLVSMSTDPGSTGCAPGGVNSDDPEGVRLMGRGGDTDSSSPSVSEDGTTVAFTSRASDLSPVPPPPDPQFPFDRIEALHAWTEGAGITMVSPPDLNGHIEDPMVSGDGDHIVFSSKATNLVSPNTPSGEAHVYLATRSGGSWTIDLVSKNAAGVRLTLTGDLVENDRPATDSDGDRIAFLSDAENIEANVALPSQGPVLVVRDLGSGATRVVLNRKTAPSGHHLGSIPGIPKLASDGTAVTVYGYSDYGGARPSTDQMLLFDADAIMSGDAAVRRESRLGRVEYAPLANGSKHTAIADAGSGHVLAFPASKAPLPGFDDDYDGLYLVGGGTIGPDISTGMHGDPVDTATGNFRQDETDLTAPGDAGPATLARTYTSFGSAGGVFGPGWMSPIDTHLDLDPDGGTTVLAMPNGQRIVFTVDDNGAWAPVEPYRISLSEGTGGDWAVTGPDSSVMRFDADGRLTSLEAPATPTVTVAWSGEVPATLTSASGYQLTFTDDTSYDSSDQAIPGGGDGYIDRVVSSDGRQVDYGYAGRAAGNGLTLHTVSRPYPTGQNSADFGVRTYETDGRLITRILDKVDANRTRVVVENVYDAWGRVSEQITADGDTTTFAYDQKPSVSGPLVDTEGFTTVTDQASGDVTVYEHNPAGELVGITDALGNDVSREWDGDRPASAESRSGVVTDHTYDAAGRVLTVTETVDSQTRTTSSVTYVVPEGDPTARIDDRVAISTDAAGVTTTYAYTGVSRQPDTVSVPCDPDSTDPATPCPGSGLSTTSFEYYTGAQEGLVKNQTDPDGVVTAFTYHPDRTLASTTVGTGADALTTSFETLAATAEPTPPPAAVELTRTTAPGGAVTVEFRDAEGRVIESRDPLYGEPGHGATVTSYFLDGEVASVTDPGGNMTSYAVARLGDPGWSEDPSIAEVRTVTDPDGVATIAKTDRSGDVVVEQTGNPADPGTLATTVHTYGELGRLIDTVAPDGVKTTYHYDEEGRTTGVTTGPDGDDPAHTVSTSYDEWGNVETTSTPAGPDPDGTPVTSTTRYVLDDAGRTVAQIDGDGDPANALMTGFEYDTAGRLWRTIEHLDGTLDPADRYVIGTGDRVAETRYTPGGRTAAQVGPPPNATTFEWSGPDPKSITSYGYDTAGRQTMVTGPDGLDTVTDYDTAGLVETVTTPGGYMTGYDYDDLGRTVTVTTPSGLTGPGDPATVQVDTTYTPTGQVATETDPYAPGVDLTPATRAFFYTPGGRVDVAVDANGDQVSYDYDARGNRTIRHSIDEDANPIEEEWGYDAADRVISHQRPHAAGTTGPATVNGYDPDYGWLNTVTDPTGRVTTNRYYTNGTPRGETHTGPSLDTITVDRWIDSRGRPVRRRDQTGAAAATDTTWTYFRDGQTATATHPEARTIGYEWDLAGTISTLTHADGAQGRYVHDSMGRVTDITVAPTPTGVGVPLATMTYDDDGRPLTETLHGAGGSTRTRDYDDAGNLTDYTQLFDDGSSGWDSLDQSLTWRTDGRMDTQTTDTGSGPSTETYSYDPAGQLTEVAGGPSPISQTYGPRGNRTTVTFGGTTVDVGYEPSGAIAGYTSATGDGTVTYDAAGRRTGATTTDAGGNPTGWSTTIAYDAAGRTTAASETDGSTTITNTRGWDGDGNLSKLTRTETGVFPTIIDYIWDTTRGMPKALDQYLYGSIHARLDYANDNIGILLDYPGIDYQWFGYDALDSAIDPNDNPNLVDGPDHHDPWGLPTPDTNAHPGGIYRGQDRYGDLVHLRAREYHPQSTQFTSPDPLDGIDGTPTVANPYHYADNDPLNKTDPTGMRPDDGDIADPTSPGGICDFDGTPLPLLMSASFACEVSKLVQSIQATVQGDLCNGVASFFCALRDDPMQAAASLVGEAKDTLMQSFGCTFTILRYAKDGHDGLRQANIDCGKTAFRVVAYTIGIKLARLIGDRIPSGPVPGLGSAKNLATVERHLGSIDALDFPPNRAMLDRVADAQRSGRQLTQGEQNFMRHELTEAEAKATGVSQAEAHRIASQTHPTYANFDPAVIRAYPEHFNSNWFAYWGIER